VTLPQVSSPKTFFRAGDARRPHVPSGLLPPVRAPLLPQGGENEVGFDRLRHAAWFLRCLNEANFPKAIRPVVLETNPICCVERF